MGHKKNHSLPEQGVAFISEIFSYAAAVVFLAWT